MPHTLLDLASARLADLDVVGAVVRAMDGTGPALLAQDPASGPSPQVPDGVAAVVTTSGSTGERRRVLLGADALRASVAATDARLGGPGRWLLALPLTHVAGLQVLVRAALAGHAPVALDTGPFRPDAFASAVASMPRGRRYTSLVPTQLHRLLADASPATIDAARSFDAILVGGAALAPALAERAAQAGLRVVTTYGMSETCGGCVYDGVPLDGVRLTLDDAGRLLIAGPVLALGYDDPVATADTFVDIEGVRHLRTQDLGELSTMSAPGGRGGPGVAQHVTILGRADDVVLSGGVNVPVAPVEAALAGWSGLGEVCVVGLDDPEWGQRVVAVATTDSPPPSLDAVRRRVADVVGAASAPRALVLVDALPLRGPGKVDRRATADLARAASF